MADIRRAGDDFGYFYFQHKSGITFFELNDAFFLCRCKAEKEWGFDLGLHVRIAEDACWALYSMRNGSRFKWINGYLEEQLKQYKSNFLKQRRRWHSGLFKFITKHLLNIRLRRSFIVVYFLWFIISFITPLKVAYLLLLVSHDIEIPILVRILTLETISLYVR